tara:strand:+ start:11575 stop:12297 length:723 start_codon:yes stop_codon:yes gene_type:complete
MNKERIKSKITALLQKTTANGASEQEAITALSKAKELMDQYFIDQKDIDDALKGEKLILKSEPLTKTGFDLAFFYRALARLFDCETYYVPKQEIFFYGYEQDVELCIYFYKLITSSVLKAKSDYVKSDEFKLLRREKGAHTKTLTASFIKGFLIRVSSKMTKMYKERKEQRANSQQGLIIYEKNKAVKNGFDSLGLSLRSSSKSLNADISAFNAGEKSGDGFDIMQGVNDKKKSETLRLT